MRNVGGPGSGTATFAPRRKIAVTARAIASAITQRHRRTNASTGTRSAAGTASAGSGKSMRIATGQ